MTRLAQPELAAIELNGLTRSSFLVRGALAAGTVYGLSAVSPFVSNAFSQAADDVEILNFALTLEFLETDFYDRALMEVSGLGGDLKKLVTEIRDNEQEHVDALTATIKDAGGKPAEKPTFDYGGAFASQSAFLKLATTLEDTGVGAYNGAGPSIQSVDVLAAAGSIVQVEARHAGLIRLQRDLSPAPRAFDEALDMDTVLAAVKPLIKA